MYSNNHHLILCASKDKGYKPQQTQKTMQAAKGFWAEGIYIIDISTHWLLY